MARYLIDTDMMIDVSRRNADAAAYVDSLDDITISIITAHELIVGARNQRDADGIDAHITGRAYQLLERHVKSDGLRTFDALIAATAIENGFTLVSKNRKHFQMIRRAEAGSTELLSPIPRAPGQAHLRQFAAQRRRNFLIPHSADVFCAKS